MAADGERSPLLSEPGDGGAGGNGLVGPGGSGAGPGGGLTPSAPPYGAGKHAPPQAFPPFPEGHPAVLPGEDPPPYSPLTSPDSGNAPMITCRVCQSLINVEGKMHQHVVKCGVCNEATVSDTYLLDGSCFLDPLSDSRPFMKASFSSSGAIHSACVQPSPSHFSWTLKCSFANQECSPRKEVCSMPLQLSPYLQGDFPADCLPSTLLQKNHQPRTCASRTSESRTTARGSQGHLWTLQEYFSVGRIHRQNLGTLPSLQESVLYWAQISSEEMYLLLLAWFTLGSYCHWPCFWHMEARTAIWRYLRSLGLCHFVGCSLFGPGPLLGLYEGQPSCPELLLSPWIQCVPGGNSDTTKGAGVKGSLDFYKEAKQLPSFSLGRSRKEPVPYLGLEG